MDDVQAILRLKRGDINGLGHLITRYQVKAVRTAFLVTQDTAMAADVVQDAFIHFYHRVHKFDERKPFEPYFFTCVKNAALGAILREKRNYPFPQDASASNFESLLSRSLSVESEIERSQLEAEMQALLVKLSPRQRAVIVQRYYLDMSEKEMSETSHTAPGTIKWLLNNARSKLRALIEVERTEK